MPILKIIGKPPINIWILLTGKISLITCWIFLGWSLYLLLNRGDKLTVTDLLGILITGAGIVFITASIFQLKHLTRIGLYNENDNAKLSTTGIYRISRNPMYAGFFMLCAASVLLSKDVFNLLALAVALTVHHQIIRAEEKHLAVLFKEKWDEYCSKTRRYL